jgi:hypothetical protein
VYELAGKGDFAGLVIPVCIADESGEANLAAAGTADQAIIVHSCTSIGDMVASLRALFDQLHVGKVQALLQMTVPKTNIADAESLVRFAIEQVGKRVQIDAFRVLPRARTYVGPLKNTALLSYFTSFEIPLSNLPSKRNRERAPDQEAKLQQHLTVWINKMSVQGNRGVALFDTTTNTQLSGIVPFKTVHDLVLAARLLVSTPHMSPSPSPSPEPIAAASPAGISLGSPLAHGSDYHERVMMVSFAPSPSPSPVPPAPIAQQQHKSKGKVKNKAPATKTKRAHKLAPSVPGGILRTRQQHKMLHHLRTRDVLPPLITNEGSH